MRFFLVVSAGVKQIRSQDDAVIRDGDETGFDRAFDIFKPGELAMALLFHARLTTGLCSSDPRHRRC